MIHAGNQKITNKEHSPRVGELRGYSGARLPLTLRTQEPMQPRYQASPCTAALHRVLAIPRCFEPSLNVFVQGRKRITLAGTTYRCDESTFLLSSIDVPVVSQIVAASEDVPLLSLLLKLDMAVVREILSQEEFLARDGSSPARLGKRPSIC